LSGLQFNISGIIGPALVLVWCLLNNSDSSNEICWNIRIPKQGAAWELAVAAGSHLARFR